MDFPPLGDFFSNVDTNRLLRYSVWLIPAILLIFYLTKPVPWSYHAAREVAGFFQSLAYLHDPVQSLFYHTPEENLSSLHLHSLLSSPFIALGYVEGGRLVSFLAAILAVVTIGAMASRLFGSTAGLVAPLALWAHPTFIRGATAFQPETLSIALTSLSVLLLFSFYGGRSERRYWLALFVLVLAIMTHLWEAIIVLPLLAISVYHDDYRRGAVTAIAGASATILFFLLTHLQPRGGSSLLIYSVLDDGNLALLSDPGWWLYYYPSGPLLEGLVTSPITAAMGLTLPVSMVLWVFWSVRFYQSRTLRSLVLSAWFLCGLSIPILLPLGFAGHNYYVWPLLAPLALSFGWAVQSIRQLVESGGSTPRGISQVFVAAIVVASFVPVGVIAAPGIMDGTADSGTISGGDSADAVHAGQEIRALGVDSANDVAFIGEHTRSRAYRHTFVAQTLVYSNILVKERQLGSQGPAILNESSELNGQDIIVWIKNGSVETNRRRGSAK